MDYDDRRKTDSHIIFIREGKAQYRKLRRNLVSRSLYLFDEECQLDILEIIPRLFTITTNNGSYRFNTEILKDTSSVILNYLENNPTNLQYHIDIKDEENVLKKIEEMYQGKLVIFDEDELPISKKFTSILNIKCCPNYMKPESLKSHESKNEYDIGLNSGVRISINSLDQFLQRNTNRTFSIHTKSKKYKVNYFGLFYSKVLREIMINDPTTVEYIYDFDDEFGEFQFICDLLNFEVVNLTINNVYSIKEIVEDLKIEFVLEKINKNIEEYEQVSQNIDDNQTIVYSIEEVFEWLYNIKENSVEFVKNSILDSIWSKSEENIHELAAFILQVIKTDFSYHSYLIDLLNELKNEANETNFLDLLLPFITDKLINFSDNSLIYHGFIYNLYKRNLIDKEKVMNQLKLQYSHSNSNNYPEEKVYSKSIPQVNLYFLPELIELNLFNVDELLNTNSKLLTQKENIFISFIKNYFPDKIDLYKKMRESGEPDDEITKSLRNDDVDTLQSIITSHKIDISSTNVPFNIFENFIVNGETNYINYAAAYGSIKCFKYLLLNHARINEKTFKYAVFGGNIEIIKIVDQKYSENYSTKQKSFKSLCISSNPETYMINNILPSIMKHQNEIFDWILQEKFSNKGTIEKSISSLLKYSAENGNAHSFIEIVDKGIDLSSHFKNIIRIASKNGFYRLTQLIWNIVGKEKIYCMDSKFDESKSYEIDDLNFAYFKKSYFVSFGNLSIFELSLKIDYDQTYLENALYLSIEKKYFNIIKFYFENLVQKDFKLTEEVVYKTLLYSIDKDSLDLFNYFFDQYKTSYPFVFKNFDGLIRLLFKACKIPSFDSVKKLTELILSENEKEDFTNSFLRAAISDSVEICQYFVDKKVNIDYEKISSSLSKLSNVKCEIFSILIENSTPEVKNTILRLHLYPAIKNRNKKLIEFLLNMNASRDFALIEASSTNDIDIVKIILKYDSKPCFINRKSSKGTALLIATENNNLSIVNLLLSIKGIDLNITNKSGNTALIIAAIQSNLDIINFILDFYGDEIQSQIWQIDESIKILLKTFYSYCFNTINPTKKVDKNKCNEISISILKRFLEIENIDPNCHCEYYTLLTYACQLNDINIVKKLLNNKRIDVNKYAPKIELTPLMTAISNENVEIAKLLIKDNRTKINFRNSDGKTALVIAVENELKEIVDLLIQNENFDPEESQLDYAFYLSSKEIAKTLSQLKSLDVNYTLTLYQKKSYDYSSNNNEYTKLVLYETSLTNAVNMNDIEMIDLIIHHHSFDKIKSFLIKAIFIAADNDFLEIFRKLIKIENDDVNITNCANNLLERAIISRSRKIITEILQNPTFDSEKSNILNAFIIASNILGIYKNDDFEREERNNHNDNDDEMIEIMNEICEYDQKHKKLIDFKKLLPNGKSFFTNKKDSLFIKEYVDFFIKHGVNPNEPDKEGVYPLEHAILIGCNQFVHALIETEKIDFSIKIPTKTLMNENDNQNEAKYKTYLHLAARSTNSKLFEDFLNNNYIDINITDDLGETPLMEAIRFRRIENIKILFKRDDLDFLHCNNKGEDANKIIPDNLASSESINDKNAYLHNLRLRLEFFSSNKYNYQSPSKENIYGNDIEFNLELDDEENYELIWGSNCQFTFGGKLENEDSEYDGDFF